MAGNGDISRAADTRYNVGTIIVGNAPGARSDDLRSSKKFA
jgi:hypothetical protein